jgi:ABC-type molybdenum transport system ATPase subunit/photorepair protein PhrA
LSEPTTLVARDARIDLLGRPLLSRLNVESGASRLALLGDWSALFRLLSGEAELAAGSVLLLGEPVPQVVQRGRVGVVRLDPPLPPAFSGEQLLTASAELAGATPRAAARAAFSALERLGLLELGSRRLAHLAPAERRCLLIAHAITTEPELLCLEEPLRGLDTSGIELVCAVIGRALPGRRLIAAVATTANDPLIAGAEERLRLTDGVVVAEAESAPPTTRVTATICRNYQAFAEALRARGLSAHPTHEAGLLGALTSAQAGPAWRYVVELPEGSTAPLLDAVLETDAGLLELAPAP